MRDRLFYLKEKIHDWYRKFGIKQIAFELGKNPKSLANEINEWSNNKHDIWTLIESMEITGSLEPLDKIEAHFKRVGVPIGEFDISQEHTTQGIAKSLASLGDVSAKISRATNSDGLVELSEEQWDDIVSTAYRHAQDLLRFVTSLYRKAGDGHPQWQENLFKTMAKQ